MEAENKKNIEDKQSFQKKSKKKERLDILVLRSGLESSRERARALIMEGRVLVNDEREDKPGNRFPEDSVIRIKGKTMPYVSRGGYKLEKALKHFQINLKDRLCMDVGASTGGFTDCMLQNGAKKVYAIDVGTNQLAYKLRQDERVVSMENTNIRYVTMEDIGGSVSFISVDVAFISLTKVLFPIYGLLDMFGEAVCLIKPQFEAGRDKVGKKGVVRDKKIHKEVIRNVADYSRSIGFFISGLEFSPVKGPEGNIEYLLYLSKKNGAEREIDIGGTVDTAHKELYDG